MSGVEHRSRWGLFLIATMAAVGCSEAAFEDRLYAVPGADGGTVVAQPQPTDSGDGRDAATAEEETACTAAVSSENIPARSSVMGRSVGPSVSGVFTSDLFGLFQSNCGACHVDNSLGGLKADLATFPEVVTREALERLTSDDPKLFMPPTNREAFSKLAPGDPLVELAGLLEAWLAAGRPRDVFYPPQASASGDAAGSYLLTKEVGTRLTNLGNCIPAEAVVRAALEQKPDKLDAMFAAAKELPERLDQTDLTTLDAESLARQGIVAYVPAYSLWADDAKKLRVLRLPRGKSIVFDRSKQSFDIPENTRFYKTFLKRVIDLEGKESYRKMETRVIVSRPDKLLADGTSQHTALFGTYAWNEDESAAVLVRDPLRNGKPFRDRVLTYITDEHAAEEVVTQGPENLQHALQAAGLTRTYALPSSDRCIQCHIGDSSFQLGFTPLQLRRRPLGEGGTLDPTERDELSQLQRLIDYGVITGMTSVDEVRLLEDSQGERKPRNEHELAAQGYMLGNCAHCHNPRGFASRLAPELRNLLDFMPSKHGGIFQFSLEAVSPRIFRGTLQNVPQPYITPSLWDRPPAIPLPNGTDVGGAEGVNYTPKQVYYVQDETHPKAPTYVLAPWRSLIYRNVDTPFTYEEDFSIYPRMPMNTPGYDCRARQVLGAWMTSIPARMKPTPAFQVGSVPESLMYLNHAEPQPYYEVRDDDPDFAHQLEVAESRVKYFKQSPRYTDCPDPEQFDTVDPRVVTGERLVPGPLTRELVNDSGEVIGSYSLRVPERPHYAVTDLTSPPGNWFPRRPDWATLLVEQDFTGVLDSVVRQRIQMLSGVTITSALRELALKARPFGLWVAKPGCDLSEQPKVSEFVGSAHPRWMDVLGAKQDAAVYTMAPGAAVFTQMCRDCHGAEGDSNGRIAATIADMTGGQTLVANLRDGFFGPRDDPGANRQRVFSSVEGNGVSSEDWAARYLMFMGLGGTQRTIPAPALQTIRNGTVLGERRVGAATLDVSTANMLSIPLSLCKATLPGGIVSFIPEHGDLNFSPSAVWKSPLIERNGDVDLWHALCGVDNGAVPVRVIRSSLKSASAADYQVGSTLSGGLRHAASYPVDAAVGDRNGQVQTGVTADNAAPWCFERPADSELRAVIEQQWTAHAGAVPPPYCPEAFLTDTANWFTDADAERWATRGAMNAGIAVFLYIDALAKGDIQHPIPHDRCEELTH